MSALLFGSLSTLADTSELQRRAFNDAFVAHGLGWHWSRDDYVEMLASSGGVDRITAYAAARGVDVDADAVHETKSRIFQDLLRAEPIAPRPGVIDTIAAARKHGHRLGFVTTTSRANVDALFAALTPQVTAATFDLIVDRDAVRHPKPDPEAYEFALRRLGEQPGHAVAIEDNLGGVAAAGVAGVACIAFPNCNTEGSDFSAAALVTQVLDPAPVLSLLNPDR